MCLIFFSLKQHPRYKLILTANRDEFYNRKTAAADFWKDYPEILGGRDLEANGTWMGMTKSGKISLLTNFRDPKNINPNAPSRGQLVSNYLEKEIGPEEYLKQVEPKAATYNGFNLLVGNTKEFFYLSNYKTGIEKIAQGLHGLSNHLMDTPWPKVERGKQKFELLLKSDEVKSHQLFEFLYDEERAVDDQLPDTGIGLDRERALSSMFIKSPNYGSRCSTVILVDQENNVEFSERVYDLNTFEFTTKTFRFKLSGK
ncbi:MAG: NRDE family protein [Bacteroidia bacterium]|nr:NRDE family protein [Bacteroidia bacterium]